MEKENDVDALARMVAEGFSGMNKKFDEGFSTMSTQMNERFDVLEKTTQETNKRIDTLIVPTLDSHPHRIKKLEEQIA